MAQAESSKRTQIEPPQQAEAQPGSLLTRLALIIAVMLLVGGGAAALGIQMQWVATSSVVSGLVVCLVASVLAHIAGEFPKGDALFMARLALSMAVRSGIPFLFVLIVKLTEMVPFGNGFVVYIVTFYLLGLFVDVLLTVRRLGSVAK